MNAHPTSVDPQAGGEKGEISLRDEHGETDDTPEEAEEEGWQDLKTFTLTSRIETVGRPAAIAIVHTTCDPSADCLLLFPFLRFPIPSPTNYLRSISSRHRCAISANVYLLFPLSFSCLLVFFFSFHWTNPHPFPHRWLLGTKVKKSKASDVTFQCSGLSSPDWRRG
jgi:hypothetical protein